MPDYSAERAIYVLTDSLRLAFQNVLSTSYNVSAKTLMALPKETATQTLIKWSAEVSPASSVGRAVTSDKPTNTASAITLPASLPIGNYAHSHNFQLLETDITQAAAVNDPSILSNAIQRKVNQASTQIMRNLNGLIFTGNGASDTTNIQVSGFDKITEIPGANGTSVYAGITYGIGTSAQNPEWVSVVVDASTEALTEGLFLDVEEELEMREVDYDLVVVSPNTAKKYKSLFLDLRSFQNVTTGDLGVQSSLQYNGRPVVVDNKCPDGAVYFIDSNLVSFHTFATRDSVSMNGINLKITPMPVQNDFLLEWTISVCPQLQAVSRKAVSKLLFDPNPVIP